MMLSPTILLGLLAALAVGLACVRRIPEGQAYTLRRPGGHLRTIGAGTHFVLPFVERIAHRIRLLGNVVAFGNLTVPALEARFRGQVYYQVLDAARADPVIDDVERLVRSRLPQLIERCRDAAGGELDLRLKAALNEQLGDLGILITRVQLLRD
jgi:regulator of protease activity HflC (stomatin/prohibitin superfamily)